MHRIHCTVLVRWGYVSCPGKPRDRGSAVHQSESGEALIASRGSRVIDLLTQLGRVAPQDADQHFRWVLEGLPIAGSLQ